MGCSRGLHCAEFHTCCKKTFLKKSIEIDAVLLFVCAAQSEKRLWCRVLWLISRVCCHILLHNEPIKQWIIMASLFGLISNQICYRYKCLRPNLKRLNKRFFFLFALSLKPTLSFMIDWPRKRHFLYWFCSSNTNRAGPEVYVWSVCISCLLAAVTCSARRATHVCHDDYMCWVVSAVSRLTSPITQPVNIATPIATR